MSRPPHPRKEEALALLRIGVSTHRVHELCGVALRTVEAWSASLGLRSVGQRRAAAEPSPRGQEVVRLLAEGATVAEVAAALEISEQAVRRLRQRWLTLDPPATAPAPAQDPSPPPARHAARR